MQNEKREKSELTAGERRAGEYDDIILYDGVSVSIANDPEN